MNYQSVLRRTGRVVEPMDGEFEYCDDLLARDRILLDDFIDVHPVLKVFENEFHRCA